MKAFQFRLRSLAIAVVALGALLCPVVTRLRGDVPQLRKGDGPFLVLAHEFRGPGAEVRAEALAHELKSGHDLPSYVHHLPARGARPPGEVFVVLVGDARSPGEAEAILRRIKRIAPQSFRGDPNAPKTLRRSYCTTNPLL